MTSNRCVLLAGAIGDAFAKFAETHDGSIHPLLKTWEAKPVFLRGNYEGESEYTNAAGNYTDDTQMVMALCRALMVGKPDSYSPERAMREYLWWFRAQGQHAPRGIGGTLKRALQNYADTDDWENSGVELHGDYVGCGTAMRIAPLGVFGRDRPLSSVVAWARTDARLTHRHIEAEAGSVAVAVAIRQALRAEGMPFRAESGRGAGDIVRDVIGVLDGQGMQKTRVRQALHTALAYGEGRDDGTSAEQGLKSSSDVASVVGSAMALWVYIDKALTTSMNAHALTMQAMVASVRVGGDTDSRTAILCALIGARRGICVLPPALISTVENRALLGHWDDRL